MQSRQGCRRDLRGEVAGLAFAQPQQPLRFLEHDFQRPPLGINPVRFKELKPYVSGHQAVPCAPFASPDKVQAYLGIRKGHVRHDVIATQSPAVLPPTLPVKVPDQGRRGIRLPVQTVFFPAVFSHLDHAQVISPDVAGADEPDDILAGEPAVCQHIPEPDPFADGASYHGNHQVGFLCRVFTDTLLQGVAAVTSFGETSCELFIGHPELSILSFFTQQCKIQKHLGCPVRDGKEQCLETEDAPVMDMGKHPADVLHAPSRLGIVRVIDYQTDRAFLAPGAESDLRPKLEGKVIDGLPPVYLGITHETVEHVFLASQQAA